MAGATGILGLGALVLAGVASAQLAADPDYAVAQAAWARADFSEVIAGTTRVLAKPGNAMNPAYAEVRYMRGAAWCRTAPATAQTRNEGRRQLAALADDVAMGGRIAPVGLEAGSSSGDLARKIQLERTRCVEVETPFGDSLSIEAAPAPDPPPKPPELKRSGLPGVGGVIRRVDDDLVDYKLQGDQRLLMQRDSRGAAGATK
jgi:hypothetical protein